MDGDERWLDMSRYPEADPDQALPPPLLALLRDVLLRHAVGGAPPVDLPGSDGGRYLEEGQ
jgi:hypothetical protein